MNKKLMAVAVAGALVAPAVAFAQASTVQIYGYLNAEYGFAKGVATAAGKTNNWDGLNSSASYIGFKGEEKLAGGMSAFFQCETDAGFLKGDTVGAGNAATQGGWCSRNSAVGLKGGFGSFYVGTWDSPTKRAVSSTRILGETGWNGVQSFLLSNSGTFNGTFSARNANSINYESPKFGGFSVAAQTTSTRAASSVTTAGLKGRSNSMSLNYAGGPLTGVVAFTKNDDNRAPGGGNGAESEALVVGGTYTFGPAKLGLTYVDGQTTAAVTGAELERKSWNIAGTYNFGGPHSMYAGYTLAGDTKTNAAVPAAGTGSNTGAKQYTIGYAHALSKRTTASLAYMRAKNDSNGNNYSVGNSHFSGVATNGSSSSVVVTRLQHSF